MNTNNNWFSEAEILELNDLWVKDYPGNRLSIWEWRAEVINYEQFRSIVETKIRLILKASHEKTIDIWREKYLITMRDWVIGLENSSKKFTPSDDVDIVIMWSVIREVEWRGVIWVKIAGRLAFFSVRDWELLPC